MTSAAIFEYSQRSWAVPEAVRAEISRSCLDTMGVLAAGWGEPAGAAVRSLSPGLGLPWEGASAESPETAALVWGTAAHALDYDDVHMTSVTHPSAVLIPALAAAAQFRPETASRRASAYAVGLAVNVALGDALGFAHYERGWHATSTLGALACGAAVAHLYDLDRAAFVSALAIAAAQAGGLQRNFGTLTKPLQAGLAAQAGVRAARLAQAGLSGPDDVLKGRNGFFSVFGGRVEAELHLDGPSAVAGVSRKLYPCCYLAHRPAAGAIALHRQGAGRLAMEPDVGVEVEVPAGCLKALTIDIPTDGAQARFSGKYAVAQALTSGALGLAAFEDSAVRNPALLDLAARVRLRESSPGAADEVGIDRGSVKVALFREGRALASVGVDNYPGSPSSPASAADLEAKLADCVAFGGFDDKTARQIRRFSNVFAGFRD